MRILSGARDAIHAVIQSFDRAVVHRSLQTHIVDPLAGCLGAGKAPHLGVGDVAEGYSKRILTWTHVIQYSCKTIGFR